MSQTQDHQAKPDRHTDIPASGCFGGESCQADPHRASSINPDRFAQLYAHQCQCKRPAGYVCTLADGRACEYA